MPYFFQLSQNLTSDCLLISLFLPVFAWCDHKNCFVLICRTILWSHHAKTGKNTEINKQSDVKFWLNWRKYGTVSYWFSCKLGCTYLQSFITLKKEFYGLLDISRDHGTFFLDHSCSALDQYCSLGKIKCILNRCYN